MFAVFKTAGNDSCSYEILLFVTPNEESAKDAVALMQLELEAAQKIARPTYTRADIQKLGHEAIQKLWDDYHTKACACFTLDIPEQKLFYWADDDHKSYFYEPVEVKHTI